MPNNEERREVAARLRRYLPYARKHDADEKIKPDELYMHGNAMFRNIAQAVGGEVSNIIDTNEETLIKLIDLIEPEPERTCRNLGREEGTNYELYDFGCSSCGYCADITEPNYCPHCRAKVLN